MKTRTASRRPGFIGGATLTALMCMGAAPAPARAEPPATNTPSSPARVRSYALEVSPHGVASPFVSNPGAELKSTGSAQGAYVPQGNEMSAIAGMELERNDRRFRSRVVNWAMNYSLAAGLATDFLVRGSDTGFHLDMQSGSAYVVQWKRRF